MKNLNLFTKCYSQQQGLTLIEILITMLIMGFGLLGVAQMQTVSLKSNYESAQRTMASYLAEDIISRMRSAPHPDVAPAPSVLDYSTDGSPINGSNPSTAPSSCTSVSNCSVTNKIKRDLWEWKEALVGSTETKNSTNIGGLLNPSGCIRVSNNQIRIIIAWDSIGKSKSSTDTDIQSCGSGDNKHKRRGLIVYTVL